MTTNDTKISLGGSLKSTLIVAFISGFAGLVMLLQDVVIASHFATGETADAYLFAISFPMLAINVFAGGTLLAVLVPLLTQLKVAARETEAIVLIKKVRKMLGWFLIAVCGIWALTYPYMVEHVAKGFSFEAMTLSARLLWISIPVLFFAGLASIDTALLNSRRHFVFISTLPAFMPAAVILCVFLLEARLGIYSAAIGLLLGSIIQWLVNRRLTIQLFHLNQQPYVSPSALFPNLIRDYSTAAVSSALLAGIYFTGMFIASSLQAGSTATYGYAVRPVILLLSFVTVVVGNVALPLFSHLTAVEDWPALKKHVLFWFGLLALGSLPVVALWYVWDKGVVELLYQRGAFNSTNTASVVAVQKIYILQIPFFLIAVIGYRVMNSLNKNLALLIITAICFIVNLVASLLFSARIGLQGIAWGTNLAFVLWAILITLYLLNIHSKSLTIAAHSSKSITLEH
jgi:putative peptidoglycan lipid II flippase